MFRLSGSYLKHVVPLLVCFPVISASCYGIVDGSRDSQLRMSGASGATDLSVSGGGGSTQDPNFRPSQEEESSEDSEGVFTQRSGD